jgi:hypothetical protein
MTSATTTESGLRVRADRELELVRNSVNVSDAELAAVSPTPHA